MISRDKHVFASLILISILMLMPFSSAGFIDDFYAKITGEATSSTASLNVTIADVTPPKIQNVQVLPLTGTGINATESTFTNLTIFFVANDTGGLNNATANFTINRSGEAGRYSAGCEPINQTLTVTTYNCSLKIWYYDGPGVWSINVSIQDTAGNIGVNNSTAFTYNTLTAMAMSPTSLTWNNINLTAINISSTNDPIIINNTGNDVSDVNVNATDLSGEIIPTDYLRATNFSVGLNLSTDLTGCAGTLQANATAKNITSGFLYRGNNTILTNTSESGQQQIYFCLRYVNASLSAQAYSTLLPGPWTVLIV